MKTKDGTHSLLVCFLRLLSDSGALFLFLGPFFFFFFFHLNRITCRHLCYGKTLWGQTLKYSTGFNKLLTAGLFLEAGVSPPLKSASL